MNKIDTPKVVHPFKACPVMYTYNICKISKKLIPPQSTPTYKAARKGTLEKAVTPSRANRIILRTLNFETPANRGGATKCNSACLYPKAPTIPRKKRPCSLNRFNVPNALLFMRRKSDPPSTIGTSAILFISL